MTGTEQDLAEHRKAMERFGGNMPGGDETRDTSNEHSFSITTALLQRPALSTRHPAEDDDDLEFKAKFGKWFGMGWKVGFSNPDSISQPPEGDAEEQKYWKSGFFAGIGTKEQFNDEAERERERKRVSALQPRNASEVGPEEIEVIAKAYVGHGGKMTYRQMDKYKPFNLVWANGMTAFRIVKQYAKMAKAS